MGALPWIGKASYLGTIAGFCLLQLTPCSDQACEGICVRGLVWRAFAIRVNGYAASGYTAHGAIAK